MNPTLEQAMAHPWEVVVRPDPDGGFIGTVSNPSLEDFSVHAESEAAVREDLPDALRVHLRTYLATHKRIPIPFFRRQPVGGDTGGWDGATTRFLDLGSTPEGDNG